MDAEDSSRVEREDVRPAAAPCLCHDETQGIGVDWVEGGRAEAQYVEAVGVYRLPLPADPRIDAEGLGERRRQFEREKMTNQ